MKLKLINTGIQYKIVDHKGNIFNVGKERGHFIYLVKALEFIKKHNLVVTIKK